MNKTLKILLIICVCMSIIIITWMFVLLWQGGQLTETVRVTNIFVDVNNDGRVDLIVSGDVIFNTEENQNFPPRQQ